MRRQYPKPGRGRNSQSCWVGIVREVDAHGPEEFKFHTLAHEEATPES